MSFKGQLEAFAAKTKANMDQVTRKVILDIGTRIVERTPVGDATLWKSSPPKGYVGGRARGSWQYGFNSPAGGDPNVIDKTGSISMARIESAMNPIPALHFISSNLVYMPRLENGWSKQAPSGMVELVKVEFSGIVDLAVQGVKK